MDTCISTEGRYNFAQLSVGPNGEVAAAFAPWTSWNTPGAPIYVSVNTGGLSGAFSSPITVHASNMLTPTPPQHPPAQPDRGFPAKPAALAWDCTGGTYCDRLYLIYVDLPDITQNDHYNVYLNYSTDKGQHWQAGNAGNPLNNDSTSNSHFLPWIAVDQTSGKIAVSWYDCRNDPNDVHTQFYAAVSSNGGTNFLSNYMLEAQNYYSSAPGTSGYDYFDYTGLAYYGGYFYSAWADNSNSTGNNPDGTSKLDIYVVKFSY